MEREFLALQTTMISKTEITKKFFVDMVERFSQGLAHLADDYRGLPAPDPAAASTSAVIITK